jgi:hypothetical protein
MSPPHKLNLKELIAPDVAPAAVPEAPPPIAAEPERLHVVERPAPMPARPPRLKERTHATSVYLEPPVFDELRALVYEERTKMHTLMLEAVDLLLKKRGRPSIKKLTGGR